MFTYSIFILQLFTSFHVFATEWKSRKTLKALEKFEREKNLQQGNKKFCPNALVCLNINSIYKYKSQWFTEDGQVKSLDMIGFEDLHFFPSPTFYWSWVNRTRWKKRIEKTGSFGSSAVWSKLICEKCNVMLCQIQLPRTGGKHHPKSSQIPKI